MKSKVVEALREGLPLITTSVGAQGLPGVEEVSIVTDDARAIAEAAASLLHDDARWRRVSTRQVEYAREHFSRDSFQRSFLGAIAASD